MTPLSTKPYNGIPLLARWQIKWLPFVCPFLLTVLSTINQVHGQSIYIEAERAQFTGDWHVESRTDGAYAGACLCSDNSGAGNDATLVIPITTAGTYNVWVRSRDFDTYTGQRLFQVGLDGVLFPFKAGGSGTNGWWWQLVGTRTLAAQTHVITLKDISEFYPRCDALFLTTNSTNPNQLTYSQLSSYTITPQPVPFWNLDSPKGILLHFDSAADVTNNFRVLTGGAALSYNNSDGGIMRFTAFHDGMLACAVLTATPPEGGPTNNLFCNVTASMDVRFSTTQESFGIFTRIPTSEDDGHLVLVNSDTPDMVRIFGAGSNPQTTTVSTNVLLQYSAGLLSTNVWYTFQLSVKNTGNGGATFTLNVFNRSNGSLVVTKTTTTASGALISPGEMGLRFHSTLGGSNQAIDLDNFSIVENTPDVVTNAAHTEVAMLQGNGTRFTFYSQPDIDGATQIVRETSVLISNSWLTVPFATGAERLFLLYRKAVSTVTKTDRNTVFLTTWSNRVDLDVNGVIYTTTGEIMDPLWAATPEVLIPRSCAQIDPQTVQVTYKSLAGRSVIANWQLGSGGDDTRVTVNFTADRTGYYSFGFSSFAPITKSTNTNTFYLLPPLYLFQRLPPEPNLITSSVTPQPEALVQNSFAGVNQPVTYGVVADPTAMPFVWPTPINPTYGFSLLNTDGTVQPAIFSPVLGLTNSLVNKGNTVSATWRVLAKAGDWEGGMEYASSNILGVTDYRHPYRVSLTHALLNMIDLIQDDNAGGWSTTLKGPYQIESQSTATQASPLTYISLALLTDNESLYQARSLPTIEYSLSRPQWHFATDVTSNTKAGYVSAATTQITVPSKCDGTAYWQGVYDLLSRLDPWIGALALNNGNVRYDAGSANYMPIWLEELGEYRLGPSVSLLQQIQNDCQTWINTQFLQPVTNAITKGSFYHYGDYPYWWGLLDLYDMTEDTNYLHYAEEGAFATMAGVFSHPMPPYGNVTANAGGEYAADATVWWKGPVRYRLGWPRTPGDTPERSVPAWLVSPVGFTLEGPGTFYATTGGNPTCNMQMMAAWAPALMRLYHDTHREIYKIYARNAMIGRFSNDPGYYVMGFTDMFYNPQYPYVGPDVSSLYYHQMPARIAYVIDFLMAEAETRSNGRINFPWAKQQGYVWFTDRIFGQPGTMYNDPNLWLWFNRDVTQVDSEQVDYLLAHGDDSFWVVLMNQSNAPVTVNLTNATETVGILTSQPVKVYENDQSLPDMNYSSPMTVNIPGGALVALRFTTQSHDVFPRAVPLTAPTFNQTLPGSWGTMNAFRIRSPFGADSLYVVLTGRPTNGASATLLLNGAPAQTDSAYPYEFSVYPWPMDQNMTFSLQLVDGGVTNSSTPVSIVGTSSVPSTAYQDWKTSHGLSPDAPDNGDSDGDGWDNLMEYALNMNPQVADTPEASLTWSTDGTHLILKYVKWRSDVSYFVETSLDLINWTTNGVTETENGGTVTASVPIDENQHSFIRLGVSYP